MQKTMRMSKSVLLLRYPGGKAKLYNYVKNIMKQNSLIGQTYIEPFAGGAGLALKLLLNNDVKKIVINDLDRAIYSFWYSVLNYTDDMCRFIYDVPLSMEEWIIQRQVYANYDKSDLLTLGKATFYLNRTNVSGIISGGVIGGKKQTGNYKLDARFNKKELVNRIIKIAKMSNRIDIYNYDVLDFLKSNDLKKYRRVFVNFDPPYVGKGGQLYKNSFKEKEHIALRDAIRKCRRKWIVTYDICELTEKLYSAFRTSYIGINYSVNNVRKEKELVVFSNNLVLPNDIEIN